MDEDTLSLDETRKLILEHKESGNFSDVLKLCNTLIIKRRADADIWYSKALSLYQLGRLEEARESCSTVLQKDVNHLDTNGLIGLIALQQGKHDEAELQFQMVLNVDAKNLAVNTQLAYLKISQGQMEAAEGYLNTLVENNPQNAKAWFLLGAVNGQQGNNEQAIHYSKHAIELDPDNPDAYYNLAQAHMQLNQLNEAATQYKEVVKRRADHFDAWNHIGIVLHEQGKPEEAIYYYKQALRIRPDWAPTCFMLAAAGGADAPDAAPKKYVKDLFDKYADKFDKQLVEELHYQTPQLINVLVRSAIERIASDEHGVPGSHSGQQERHRILDFGCGTGLCGPLIEDISDLLVGVDLSPKMLEKAEKRGMYDELVTGDLATILELGRKGRFDMIVAADVYPYIGAMKETLQQCHDLLKSGGLLTLSVESNDVADDYVLRETNRYAHNSRYVRREASIAGFDEIAFESVVLRVNRGKPVHGFLFVFISR